MLSARLEHANITVTNPVASAEMLMKLLGWHIRWQGPAKDNGYTVHVGSKDHYLALYSPGKAQQSEIDSYHQIGGLNHIGIVVEDLAAVEARVIAAGFTPNSHGDYEPGKRFYFYDGDRIEFEIISYTN